MNHNEIKIGYQNINKYLNYSKRIENIPVNDNENFELESK